MQLFFNNFLLLGGAALFFTSSASAFCPPRAAVDLTSKRGGLLVPCQQTRQTPNSTPRQNLKKTGRQTLCMAAARATAPVKIPNLFEKLPWNAKKAQEREARRLQREAAKLYRELGITEDASFEEITEATERIKMKFKDDLKRQIKVDVAKDKIMQLRLEQRMGGLLGQTKEARADTYLKKDAEKFKKSQDVWEPPKWTKGLIVKPNEVWRDNMVLTFGGLSIAGLLFPGMAKGLSFMASFCAAGMMGSRGVIDDNSDPQFGMSRFRRGPVGIHNLIAVIITLTLAMASYTFTNLLAILIPTMKGNRLANSMHNGGICLVLGFATAYLQIYRKK